MGIINNSCKYDEFSHIIIEKLKKLPNAILTLMMPKSMDIL